MTDVKAATISNPWTPVVYSTGLAAAAAGAVAATTSYTWPLAVAAPLTAIAVGARIAEHYHDRNNT
jgi:hypothetical protein